MDNWLYACYSTTVDEEHFTDRYLSLPGCNNLILPYVM